MAKTASILAGMAAIAVIAVVAAPGLIGRASSPESWDKFRAELVQGCIKATKLANPRIVVAPEGTASYGVALLTSETDADKMQNSVVCIMRKTPSGLTDVEVTPPASEWIAIK